jgi:alpha-beta hydrolase superfamily lysophospholipase
MGPGPLRRRNLEALLATALAVTSAGCDSGKAKESPPTPAPTVSAAPAPPPPTPKRATSFGTEDGAALAGDLWLASDPKSPVVILIHRLSSDRSEFAPLAERLSKSDRRYSILSFDLRGHGASKAPEKQKQGDTSSLRKDVEGAIDHVEKETQARGIVLVGSSLGATLACEVAFSEPKVTGLVLVSPGAAISGHDIYRPYAEVRNLATLILGAKQDTVSQAAVDALEKMAMAGRVTRYEGTRHSAGHLADQHPEVWADVEGWLMEMYTRETSERKSLYFAPGKEPKQKARASATPKQKGAQP